MTSKFCTQCGTKLNEGSSFCIECGLKLTQTEDLVQSDSGIETTNQEKVINCEADPQQSEDQDLNVTSTTPINPESSSKNEFNDFSKQISDETYNLHNQRAGYGFGIVIIMMIVAVIGYFIIKILK